MSFWFRRTAGMVMGIIGAAVLQALVSNDHDREYRKDSRPINHHPSAMLQNRARLREDIPAAAVDYRVQHCALLPQGCAELFDPVLYPIRRM